MLRFLAVFGVFALPLCFSNNVYELNARDFEGYIRDKDIMLVDFYAPWCPHCQELNPELDAAANFLATKNQFVFAKVDCVNDGKLLCEKFNVQGYPTIKLFKYGQYVGDYVGQRDKNSLMQYVDSVASTIKQHAPLTAQGVKPSTLAEAIESHPQAQAFPSPQASSIHAPAPAIAPQYINQVHAPANNNPSLMASFYGSSAQHAPANIAAYAAKNPYIHQASPDSLQSKFGNMASLDVYRSKLKMIAAYKNYQRRLKEYRMKLTAASKANVQRNPAQGYTGAVTQPPRPGVNVLSQPQGFRGYYRPEAMAAQNVQINRAVPQANYGQAAAAYPNQYASPYGYQALNSSPYYRSKMGQEKDKQKAKQHVPAARPANAKAAVLARQAEVSRERNAAVKYNARLLRQRQQLLRQQQQQKQKQLQDQQHRQQQQQQQQQQPLPQAQDQQPPPAPPPQKPHPQVQDPQQQQNQQTQLQEQQALQPGDKPAPTTPGQSGDALKPPDPSALKDLKADIESAIQDALKNAAKGQGKTADKTKPTTNVTIGGARATSQASMAVSGSGAQSLNAHAHGSGIEDAVTGEGSGSGAKIDS